MPVGAIMSDNTKVIGRYQTSRDCTKRDEIIGCGAITVDGIAMTETALKERVRGFGYVQ